MGLRLGLLGLLRLLGQKNQIKIKLKTEQRRLSDETVYNCIRLCFAYKDCSGCRGWAWTWGRGSGGSGGALIGGDVESRSAGLSSDALLQLSEQTSQTSQLEPCCRVSSHLPASLSHSDLKYDTEEVLH